jgi:4-hydroxy-2-oxoheptanedioate aldolase
MHCASGEFAAGAIKRGFDMVMLTSDIACMADGAKIQLDAFKNGLG